MLQPLDMLDAVFDLGLHQNAGDIGNDFLGQFGDVLDFDQAFGREIADETLEIFTEADGHLLGFLTDLFVLSAELAADGTEGATEHFAEALVLALLVVDDGLAIFLKALHGRDLCGKDLIEKRALGFPMTLESGHSEIGFRFESVVKTAFVDTRLGANVVDADGAVAALPNQVHGDGKKSLFGIAFWLHGDNVVD